MAQQTIGTPVKATSYTVSFQENVKGWVSFKSFIPENGISCASNYFTFNKGRLFRHHDESELLNRNTFYEHFKPSTVDFIFNQASGTIKSFEAINYEGSQARVEAKTMLSAQLKLQGVHRTVNLDNYGENFEIAERQGWYVQNLETEQDKGTLKEFVNKEKKWFNYIHGTNLNVSEDSTVGDYDPRNFANQGLGVVTSSPVNEIVQGCTCNGSNENGNGEVVDCTSAGDLGYDFVDGTVAAFNYYDAAVIDDGSCVEVVHGCIDSNASNYDATANTDDGSCYTLGCTDPLAINYNELADTACNKTGLPDDSDYIVEEDNKCCKFCIYGCTNSGANNYDEAATCDGKFGDIREDGRSCDELGEGIDCGCQETELGCLDTNDYSFSGTTIENFSTTANTEDGSCVYRGCSDQTAQYFRVPLPMPYDQDHLLTTNTLAFATDPNGFLIDINTCSAANAGNPLCASRSCWSVINDMQTDSLNADYQSYLTQLSAIGPDLNITTLQPCPTDFFDTTNCTYATTGCTDPIGCSYSPLNTVDDGSCLYCGEGNYFNYDEGYTLSGGTCGPSTQTGNCVSCPIVDPSSMDIQSQSLSEVSLWFEVSFNDQVLIDLGDSFPLGGKPNWLNTPGFKFRIYDLNTIPTGGSVWNDADYEVVDFTSAFGAPGSGFDASHGMTSSGVKYSTFKSTLLQPGITSVVGSRQSGVISTSTGYNSNTTLSLGCGHQYQLALQTQCLNPDNNHSTTADWQQNVGVITMDPCADPDVYGCPKNPIMFNSDCKNGNHPTSNPYTPCQDNVTVDDGSCILNEVVGCMDPTLVTNILSPNGEHAQNYNQYNTHDCNGNLPNTASGTYGDNSCCEWRGCTDPTHPAYDAQANFPDHTVDYSYCKVKISGCTDSTACNYDPAADTDDGSCVYGKLGCTDPTACNYNASAACDDGSCIMPPCTGCTGFTHIPDVNFRYRLNNGPAGETFGSLGGYGHPHYPTVSFIVNWYDQNGDPATDYTTGEYCETNDICTIPVLDLANFSQINQQYNQIETLKGIEDFAALEYLRFDNNLVTSFDVSQNTALTFLHCGDNPVTSLDVSNNTALTDLICNDNQLTSLDVSMLPALTSLNCATNQLTNLDVTQNTALNYLFLGSNQLTSIDVTQNTALLTLSLPSNSITTIDLTNNINLASLSVAVNQLTSLDVSDNTALTNVSANDNLLTSLDLSSNPALDKVIVARNQLTSLDLRNGHDIQSLRTDGNPNLTCISVNNVTFAIAQLTNLPYPQSSIAYYHISSPTTAASFTAGNC